jgi:hypothetical protein
MFTGILRMAPLAVVLAVACGTAPRPQVKEKVSAVPSTRESSITTEKEDPKAEPFHPTSGPGDVPVPYVRDEHTSRLDVPLPKGRAHESWRAPLGGAHREPCRGQCAPLQGTFVLAAGDRVAVTGKDEWVLFDTIGHRLDGGKVENGSMRLDRVSGALVPDETRPADTPPEVRLASHGGLVATVKEGSVSVGERAIEGKFDAFDVAIDESDVAFVVVRQADSMLLWSVPVAAEGTVGRQKLPASAHRAVGPPLLGKRLRVLPLDTGLVALGLDGKRVWERRGIPSGGASITSDDHVIVADNGIVLAIDPRGRLTELWRAKDVVFVTPPVLNAAGVLFVASGDSLHALAFPDVR